MRERVVLWIVERDDDTYIRVPHARSAGSHGAVEVQSPPYPAQTRRGAWRSVLVAAAVSLLGDIEDGARNAFRSAFRSASPVPVQPISACRSITFQDLRHVRDASEVFLRSRLTTTNSLCPGCTQPRPDTHCDPASTYPAVSRPTVTCVFSCFADAQQNVYRLLAFRNASGCVCILENCTLPQFSLSPVFAPLTLHVFWSRAQCLVSRHTLDRSRDSGTFVELSRCVSVVSWIVLMY